MRFELVLERLSALPRPLPAAPATLEPHLLGPTSPSGEPLEGARLDQARLGRPGTAGRRDAAALVLLYPDAAGEAHVILIERAGGVHVHAGQVALPGGKRDDGDSFPEGTALREASEEVGLDPRAAGVRSVGLLDAVDVRVSGHLMVPVLATAPAEPTLRPDDREVARLLRVPVRHFLPGAAIQLVEAARGGWQVSYGAYSVAGVHVWGATALVLGQLGAVLGRDS